jgi:hypothetical protein
MRAASSSLSIASIRMMPSEVLTAQLLTHLLPTKYRLSNARPGGGAGIFMRSASETGGAS